MARNADLSFSGFNFGDRMRDSSEGPDPSIPAEYADRINPLLSPQGKRIRLEQLQREDEARALPGNLASMFKREADPYSAERDQVIRDPSGALNDSPFFKFMQEKYLNNATAKNAAGGLRNSGRGLMALGEAGQKASADYLFPYLQALGRPQSGANAFFEAYKFMNTPQGGGGGGFRQPAAPRQSLSMVGAPEAPAAALPSGGATPYSEWTNPYGEGMGPRGEFLPGYGPSSGAGTGFVETPYGRTDFAGYGSGGNLQSSYSPMYEEEG